VLRMRRTNPNAAATPAARAAPRRANSFFNRWRDR
jgi:hypothetical protein